MSTYTQPSPITIYPSQIRANARVYIAGHRGLVDSAMVRRFEAEGYSNLITRTHQELDLTEQSSVRSFFQEEKPEYIIMADACVHVMGLNDDIFAPRTRPMCLHINIGVDGDTAIAELAGFVKRVTGFQGDIVFNTGMPDGPPRKWLDVSLMEQLGWKASIGLEEGLRQIYQWFLEHETEIRD